MGNHCIECRYCGEDLRGSTMALCQSQEEANECYKYQCDEEQPEMTTQRTFETAVGTGVGPYIRPEVLAFAVLMESQLRANDHKPGWKNDHPVALLDRLHEEATELREALTQGDYPEQIALEAADVANFALMIADVCGCLGEKV